MLLFLVGADFQFYQMEIDKETVKLQIWYAMYAVQILDLILR